MRQRVLDRNLRFLSKYREHFASHFALDSPLRKLSDAELMTVCTFLSLYVSESDADHPVVQALQEAQSIAKDAALLSERITHFVWEKKPLSDLRFGKTSRVLLLNLLNLFSKSLSNFANNWTKKGSDVTAGTDYLISASHIVRISTGAFHDEDLAQFSRLLQGGTNAAPSSGRSLSKLSGAAIRKRRDLVRRLYPARYKWACDMADAKCLSFRRELVEEKEQRNVITLAYGRMLADAMGGFSDSGDTPVADGKDFERSDQG